MLHKTSRPGKPTTTMKFRDGMWQLRDGVSVDYAEEVHQIKQTERGISLLCPTRKILNRGDTLNRSILTIVRSHIWG